MKAKQFQGVRGVAPRCHGSSLSWGRGGGVVFFLDITPLTGDFRPASGHSEGFDHV